MGALAQLETFLQELLERPAWLLSPRRLRPVELASALTRELESREQRLGDRIVIPGRYEVLIAGEDLTRLATDVVGLEEEMADYIQRLAVERELSLTEPPRVRIRQGSDLQPGQVVVRSSLPAAAGSGGPRGNANGGIAGWRRAADNGASRAGRLGKNPSLALLDGDGREIRRFSVDRPSLTLGRRSDNDIPLADVKISRRHARVDLLGGRYFLTDLDSTNGTRVNGREVSGRVALRSGDVIELGLQRLRFDT